MVFSDTGDLHGGFMDTNAGVDYHVPVRGARTGPPPLRVVHVSVEMAPIAKVGDADPETLRPFCSLPARGQQFNQREQRRCAG